MPRKIKVKSLDLTVVHLTISHTGPGINALLGVRLTYSCELDLISHGLGKCDQTSVRFTDNCISQDIGAHVPLIM